MLQPEGSSTHRIFRQPIDLLGFSLACLVLCLAWRWIQPFLFELPYFGDELAFTEGAARFLGQLNYSSQGYPEAFDVKLSTGIASSWAGGLGWLLSQELWISRLANIFWSWALVTTAGMLFFRRFGFRPVPAFLGAALVWAALQKIPYFFGYIHNLGELNSMAILSIGALLMERFPRSGYFLIGVAVWLGKFVYFPVALAVILCFRLARSRSVAGFFGDSSVAMAYFLLPLFVWAALAATQIGIAGLPEWGSKWFRFVAMVNADGSVPRGISNLFVRLRLPELEWVHYSLILKVKIVGLLVAPAALAVYGVVRPGRWDFRKLFSLATVGLIAFYSAWYFLWHGHMWLRHLQPALYFGFLFLFSFGFVELLPRVRGVLLFVVRRISSSGGIAPILGSLTALAVIVYSVLGWTEALERSASGDAYVRRCRGSIVESTCRGSL